jgi:hypothetical protein
MPVMIRKAAAQDVPVWLELLRYTVGSDYPDPQVYEPAWAAVQLQENETWVAENNGRVECFLSFLAPIRGNTNPVANIGRHFTHPDSYASGSAAALMEHAVKLSGERKQVLISRVIASDNHRQILFENAGFSCVGFQPFKHTYRVRESVLFYYRLGGHQLGSRFPLSDSLPQVAELAGAVLKNFTINNPPAIRDGIIGYPILGEVELSDGTVDDYELWKVQAQARNPATEISGAYNQGIGYLRSESSTQPPLALFSMREGQMVAGILYVHDEIDRCVRLIDSFSQDDISMGMLLNQMVKKAQEQFSALYVELDILATAARLLKSAEQIGFVPISYMPAIFYKSGGYADVVKLVKLNLVYSLEHIFLTSHAKQIVDVVDQAFQDERMGVAVTNLLRALPFFQGLGDGELRKISRLFSQKLFRAGEKIFGKADSGNEAYVVMRGQIDILLDEGKEPIAQFGSGEIFGELAFLDNSPRTAMAIATQPSILLVMQRGAFSALTQREPHLGLVVMRNIALELSNRLRKTNLALSQAR